MSGEDELRKLDEAYTAGRLSAEDYRQRRDALLSQSGGQQGQRPDPFPPAFRWENTEPSETTQYIPPVPGAPDHPSGPDNRPGPDNRADPDNRLEQTQVIHPGGPEPTDNSDTTQVVPARPPGPGPAGLAAAPPSSQEWNSYQPFPPTGRQDQGPRGPEPSDDAAPPWASLDDTDLGMSGWGSASYQEPDAFATDPAPSRGRIFAIIGAVVLIAALVTGAVLFFTLGPVTTPNDAETTAPAPPPPPAQPTAPPEPEPFGPVVVPSGAGVRQEIYTPTQFDDQNELAPAESVVVKQSGIAGARSVIVDNEDTITSLWAFTPSSDPEDLREELDTQQEERFDYVRLPGAGPPGLTIYTSEQENAGKPIVVFRTHYVAGRDVIRVEVFAAVEDAGAARERFDAVLADQFDHNPPS